MAKFDDDDEVMKFEITDQDLEEEMGSSYGRPRMSKNQVNCTSLNNRHRLDYAILYT